MSSEQSHMIPTRCAICGCEDNSDQLYPANVTDYAFNSAVFSARRQPDRVHYRMVRCKTCGLVRSDPVAPPDLLGKLYSESSFDYAEEVGSIQRTYGRYLRSLEPFGARRGSLLEIGTGNGFLLEEALSQGYADVWGVEPSKDAIAKASPTVRSHIVADIMRPDLFPEQQFDVVCMFQVLDHIPDPAGLLRQCFQVLKPGGFMLCLNHNIDAISARLLRDRSPIVDVEHTYLYTAATMRALFQLTGFQVRSVRPVLNDYPLRYLFRLLPLPASVKSPILKALQRSRLGSVELRAPLGNLCLVAARPAAARS